MTYTTRITNVEKLRHQATGKNLIDVSFEIIGEVQNEDENAEKQFEVVATRRVSFPASTSQEEIEAEVAKHVETYAVEKDQSVAQRELDKEDENIASIRDNLVETDQETETADDNEKQS